MSTTAIEWTEQTWNPIAGCTPISPGCLNCYAATMSNRLDAMGQEKYVGLTVKRNGRHTFNGNISFDETALSIPLKRRKPTVWFVNSMSDLFHEAVPFEFVDKVFAVMALTPQHTYQVLTKRPERMAEYLAETDNGDRLHIPLGEMELSGALSRIQVNSEWSIRWGREGLHCDWPLPNVWLGTSIENQKVADERIPHLLKCPAAVRFLSVEPMLGDVRLFEAEDENYESWAKVGIHWAIVGGESGPKSRPFNVDWARSIIRQCKAAEVACFVKQLGSDPFDVPGCATLSGGMGWHHAICDCGGMVHGASIYGMKLADPKGGDMSEWPEDLRVRQMPEAKP